MDDDDTTNTTPDLRIEVTPLAPLPAIAGGQRAPRHPQKRFWQVAVISGVILIALAVIFSRYTPLHTALTGWALPQPTVGSTPEPTPALLGALQSDCPQGNPVGMFSPSFRPGVGVHDLHIWFVGFDGPRATARFDGGVAPTSHGWPYRLGLVAASDISQPIILSGQGIFGTEGQVWFSANGVEDPVFPLVLDPMATPLQADDWHAWLFYILLPSSGCFQLDVQSGDVHTGTFFAAGV